MWQQMPPCLNSKWNAFSDFGEMQFSMRPVNCVLKVALEVRLTS